MTNPGRHLKEGLQREPFEITVLMKREKLQALRSDFTSTREEEDHPCAATVVSTQIHKYTRFFMCMHTNIHTIIFIGNYISIVR